MRHAFTLIELMIVVSIIAVICAIAIPQLAANRAKTQAAYAGMTVVHKYYHEGSSAFRVVLLRADGTTIDIRAEYTGYQRAEVGKPWVPVAEPTVEAP